MTTYLQNLKFLDQFQKVGSNVHGSKIQTLESEKKIYIKNSKLVLIFIFTYPVNLGIKICSL